MRVGGRGDEAQPAEASARQIFGTLLGEPTVDVILAALRARGPMPKRAIYDLFTRNKPARLIHAAWSPWSPRGRRGAARSRAADGLPGCGRPGEGRRAKTNKRAKARSGRSFVRLFVLTVRLMSYAWRKSLSRAEVVGGKERQRFSRSPRKPHSRFTNARKRLANARLGKWVSSRASSSRQRTRRSDICEGASPGVAKIDDETWIGVIRCSWRSGAQDWERGGSGDRRPRFLPWRRGQGMVGGA